MARARKRKRQPKTLTSYVRGAHNIKLGQFTADKICLEEACINNVVLRVPMQGIAQETKKKANLSRSQNPSPAKIGNGLKKRVLELPNGVTRPITQSEKRYCLHFPQFENNHGKININFTHLSGRVCAMKLPSKSWRLTVLMSDNLTTIYTFTSCEPLRSVRFSEDNPYFNISIEGLPVVLLGCPETVTTVRDIEILLEIVNSLSLQDCMVDMLG